MSQTVRDPRANPMPGDVWSWAPDCKPTAIVATPETLDGIWFNSPVDNLPMSHFISMQDFLRWTGHAGKLVKMAEERK